MPTTPNYSLPYPTLSDAPNGPAAFQDLAEAVDTQLDAAIGKTLLNAKGDLVVASAADTAARLAVGSNGQVLTADSAAAAGVKWATAASATAGSDYIATSQALASTSYADLATVGPTVTVTVGALGIAIVTLKARARGDLEAYSIAYLSFAVSGANTIAAGQENSAVGGKQAGSTSESIESALTIAVVLTGLTPGSTTFTAKYRTDGTSDSVSFLERKMGVVTF